MSRNPYGPDELDREDASLDRVADQLERYASERSTEPPMDLASRIMATIDDEPDPARGWWTSFLSGLEAWRTPARALAVAAVVVAAVVSAIAFGELAERARQDNVGSSPSPGLLTPSATPTATPTPSPAPTESPSPSPSPSPTASPSASDDDDEIETPEPDESDNSGPGGGGDSDNSGPGGGG
jgi:hypothetical protein